MIYLVIGALMVFFVVAVVLLRLNDNRGLNDFLASWGLIVVFVLGLTLTLSGIALLFVGGIPHE